MMQDDVKQAAVNKVVVHLQRLGYVLKPSDLDLVKQAIMTLRSTKAAARFMCASLGGSAKCLAPLPTVEVRMDADAKAPASRIPSPQEIKLRGMKLPAMIKVAKVVAPRMPKATPRREAPRAADAEVTTAVKKAKKPATPNARAPKAEPKKPATAKAQTTPAAKVKSKPKSRGGAKAQPKPEPPKKEKPSCPPCPEPAKAPKGPTAEPATLKEAKQRAMPLLKQIDQLTDQALKAQAVAAAARDQSNDKRLSRSKRKKASDAAEKAESRYSEKLDQSMDVQRQVEDIAFAAGTTSYELRQAHRDKQVDKKARKTMKVAKQQDAQYQQTMGRARKMVADAEQESKPKLEAEKVDEGTALVNQLAAQLLEKR